MEGRREGEEERRGMGKPEVGCKVGAEHSFFVALWEKKILNAAICALESVCLLNFKTPLAPLFFFFLSPPLLCVYKLQAVTQLLPWQYLSV